MKSKKCYISGPITGIPDGNKARFLAASEALKAIGYEPVNPHDNGVQAGAPWAEHMRADIAILMGCDRIFMLPGWTASKGARIEYDLAAALGIPLIRLTPTGFREEVA